MEQAFSGDERMTLDQFLTIIERSKGKPAGAVRTPLGIASNFEHVHRFLTFAGQLLNEETSELRSR